MKKLFLILFCLLGLSAQAKDFWTPMRSTPIGAFDRRIIPDHFQLYNCSIEALKAEMSAAPDYTAYQLSKKYREISLPMPDGSVQRFGYFNDPQMEKELAEQYPDIQTFTAFGIDDPYAYAKLDYTQFGFHGMIITLTNRVFIDPYAFDNDRLYISYYASDNRSDDFWSCAVNTMQNKLKSDMIDNAESKSMLYNSCGRKNFRLALACTGEYAAFFGGTTAGALAGMTTTMARCNGVYEKDLAYHLNMVSNTSLLIYLNSGTDPYTNNDGGAMLGENQTTCDAVIGNSNYDIGHVFSTGGGGVAYLGSICANSIKAGGVTGSGSPTGDNFDIDYVVHEMGHQFGANHTQNNNCNRNNATAMEPGSGITIMGYAGICAPNIDAHSIDIYHVKSIEEIETENPTCHTSPVYTNNAPVISTAALTYSIPTSTPFFLTASATDADGDALTYCWETYDNGIGTMPPTGTCTTCPNFRDFLPTASPTRYFPNMTSLIAGTATTWEVLPTVARLMKFKVTVRDNHAGGGCLDQVAANITSVATATPFAVTSPVSTTTSWAGNSSQTVTWNVAGTTSSPISCANVDILMSTDGGLTFPTVLANDVPNDGSQAITAPNITTINAVIMVVCSSNIFFNISGPVDITAVAACPTITDGTMTQTAPGPDPFQCESASMTVCVDVDITGDADAMVEFSYDNGLNWTTGTYNATTSQFCFSYTVDVATNNCDGQLYTILARFVSSTIDVGCDVDLETATDFVTVYPVLDPVPTPTQATPCAAISITAPTCAEGGPLQVYYNVDFTNPSLTDLVNVLGSSYTPNPGEAGTITFSIVNNAAIDGTTCYIIEGTPFTFDCACFTINTPTTSTNSICPNDVVSSIAVTTNETAINGIEYVYFTSAQTGTAMYSGGVSLGTTTADAGGIATLSNFNLPATPGDYYIYAILVNDNPACQPYTESIITVHPTPVVSTITSTNPTTCNGTDGTITLTGLNASEAYTVNYDFNTVSAPSQTISTDATGTLIISGLTEGSYTNINVTQFNCTSLPESATLTDPITPVINTTSTNPTTCGGTEGTITINGLVIGQSYTVSYTVASSTVTSSIVATSTSHTITGLNAGLYNNITVTYAGCISNIESETLTNPTAPTFTVTSIDATSCAPPNGSLTLSGLDVSENYILSYQTPSGNQLVNITSDINGEYIISALAGGTYSNIVLIQNGCSSASAGPFTLTGPSLPTYTLFSSANPSICGLNDGEIALSDMTANTTYTLSYNLDGSPTTATITTDATGNYTLNNLVAGAYTNIIITNASNCSSAAQAATLTNPAPVSISVTASNTSTCGGADGQFTINGLISGQTYTYSYDYNSATVSNTFTATATSQALTGLSAGAYSNISVSSLGCTSNIVATSISDPAIPSYTLASSDPSICGMNDGEITLSGLMANTNYDLTYDIDGTPNTTTITTDATGNYTLSNLVAGAYTNIIITNASNCSSTAQAATLINPAPVTINVTASNTSTCGGADGQFTINGLISGQTYTYSYDYNSATASNTFTATTTSQTITGLSAGAYSNISVSSLGCTSNIVATSISDPAIPSYTLTSSDPSICGMNDGEITLSGLMANTNYDLTYDIDGAPNTTTITTDATGNYTLSNLVAGAYTNIIITNASNCSSTAQAATLINPAPVTISVTASNTSTCSGADGRFTINGLISGQTYSYSYDYNSATVSNTFTATTTSQTIIGLSAGAYSNISVSSLGCTSNIVATSISDPAIPSYTLASSDPSICGLNDGEITLSGLMANSNYDLTYDIDGTPIATTITTDATGNYTLSNLVAGAYTNIILTNASNCSSATHVATLINPAPITISVTASNTSTCGGTDGQFTINGLNSGQTYTYSYDFNSATVSNTFTATATSQTITGLSAGAYSNISVSSLGCTSNTVATSISDPAIPTYTLSSSDITVCAGADGLIQLSGLTANTTYTIDYAYNSSNVNTVLNSDAAGIISIAGLTSGDYSNITVSLSACTSASQSVSLTEPSTISLTENSTDVTCNSANDGQATITATGGSCALYNYAWSHDATLNSNSATNLAPGSYTVIVTDDCGAPLSCSSTISFTITEPAVVATPTTTNTVFYCLNASPSTLTASGTGTIQWYDASSTPLAMAPNPSTTSVGTTTYFVSQILAGCESALVPVTVSIIDCTVLPIALTIIDPCECTGGGMIANIQATGGTAPYTVTATTAINPVTGTTYTLAELNALIDPTTGILLMPITEATPYSVTIDDSDPLTTAATYTDLIGCDRPTLDIVIATDYCISTTQSLIPLAVSGSSSSTFNITASAGIFNSTDTTLTLDNAVTSTVVATDENNCVSDNLIVGPYDCTVTPLTLSALQASNDCKETTLSWTTYQEQDVLGFDIYRSYDGIHFEKIDHVISQGASLSSQHYSYSDTKSSASITYYKIVAIDMNGTTSSSNITYAERNCQGAIAIQSITPNPFNTELFVSMLINAESKINIEILELNGRVVASHTYQVSVGTQLISIPTDQLASALYFVKISDDKNVYEIQKLVKSK